MIDLIFWPLLATFVLTGIHVYLGLHVVTRGVIFVDLALAQVAALGAAVGIVMESSLLQIMQIWLFCLFQL